MEKIGCIPLAVEHYQRIILFSISRLDAMGCISILQRTECHSLGVQLSRLKVSPLFFEACMFAEGGFKFEEILFLLLFLLGKTSFCGSNILFNNGGPGVICAV